MKRTVTLMVLVFALWATAVVAQVPTQISFQGRLTDLAGDPVADGPHTVTFKIYDGPGTELWSEQQTVTTTNGLFSAQLGGSGTPIIPDVFSGEERYLGVTIGADPELTPRTRLTSVPYASRPGQSHTPDKARVIALLQLLSQARTDILAMYQNPDYSTPSASDSAMLTYAMAQWAYQPLGFWDDVKDAATAVYNEIDDGVNYVAGVAQQVVEQGIDEAKDQTEEFIDEVEYLWGEAYEGGQAAAEQLQEWEEEIREDGLDSLSSWIGQAADSLVTIIDNFPTDPPNLNEIEDFAWSALGKIEDDLQPIDHGVRKGLDLGREARKLFE